MSSTVGKWRWVIVEADECSDDCGVDCRVDYRVDCAFDCAFDCAVVYRLRRRYVSSCCGFDSQVLLRVWESERSARGP